MANQRLFLVYRPTGRFCTVGKRGLAEFWIYESQGKVIHEFYKLCYVDHCEGGHNQDDFIIVRQNDPSWESKMIDGEWRLVPTSASGTQMSPG